LGKHLDDPILNVDFPALQSFGITSLSSNIDSYHLKKDNKKINETKILTLGSNPHPEVNTHQN
jgi:hypothetical protein